MPRLLALVLSISFLSLSIGCSRHVGNSIEVPEIPASPATSAEARARLTSSIALSGFKDVREEVLPIEGVDTTTYTQPQGAISQTLEAAVSEAMKEKGMVISGDAPISLWGEVRKWRADVETTTTTNIKSEAALYVELLNSSGQRLYAGTYHGSRASQFPIATADDIKSSLGIAMAQAIGQFLEDEEFLQALLQR